MTSTGRIHRLPDDLVNKIAAGEVVERPASVVKELVENAMDAGATRVNVTIDEGGKKLIRVIDDGSGMGRADAELAVERHATSKIERLSELQEIATHGFRGEALPSIASVSHTVLRTAEAGAPAGTEIDIRHGRREHARDAGHPRGTTVEVSDLFGAVPARRKFLRSAATEAGHVAEAMTLLALGRPDVGFFLESAGRRLVEAPTAAGLRERVFQLFGPGWLDEVVPVDGGHDWVRVHGYISRPDGPATTRARLRLFVNGRAIRDRSLSKAVSEGFRAAGASGRLAEAVLFVEAPLHLVDVNVHPSKSEVRFADVGVVFRAVENAVREALSAGARQSAPRAVIDGVREAAEGYLAFGATEPRDGLVSPARSWPAANAPEYQGEQAEPHVVVLGQHRATYIVATDGDEVLLYDQHTSHERVRFEAILATLEGGHAPSQRLLAPVVAQVPPTLLPLIEEHAAVLDRLGYEVAPFGGGSVRLSAVPELVARKDPLRHLLDLLEDFHDRQRGEWLVTGSQQRLTATLACHSAARAGETLSVPAMRAIVEALGRTTHPTLCPHGRPTMVRVPKDEVSRWFERVGWRRR